MSDRDRHGDQTARLVSHAAAWSAGIAREGDPPPRPEDWFAERDLTTVERATALRSARYAAHAYPGPVGDLIRTKIEEYVTDGKMLGPCALADRLVRSMQTMESRSPLAPRRGYDHLPAIHVPGSGSRWRYRTAADADCG
jgi:hypothetical protein